MATTTLASETAYEDALRARRAAAQTRQARGRVLGTHREEVEEAVSLDRGASRVEDEIRRYDDPNSDYRNRVMTAKRAMMITLAVGATYAFIWMADFWLATPDVAEYLANKSMTLVAQFTGAVQTAKDGVSVTPVWLRLVIGGILTSGFLALTAWVKSQSNEAHQHEAIQRIQPGDDHTFRRIQRVVWFKRLGKVGYLGALAMLLYLLYQYDLTRAHLWNDLQTLSTETKEWADVGIRISGGELQSDESTGTSKQEAKAANNTGDSSADLARPALVVYCLLFMLHGVILLAPAAKAGQDRELASFRRGAAGRRVDRLREREGRVLRDLLHRINENDGELRDALIREAQPVAARINAAAMGDPVTGVTDASPSPQPDAGETTSTQSTSEAEASHEQADGATVGSDQQGGPTSRRHRSTDDVDPYAAIFGTPA